MAAWQSMPLSLPVDAAEVWVRVTWASVPFLATWSLAAQTFTTASGLVLPWYAVQRWRV